MTWKVGSRHITGWWKNVSLDILVDTLNNVLMLDARAGSI